MTSTHIHYEIVDTIDPKTWDANVSHPLQSFAWGQFRRAMGIILVRIVGKKNDAIVSCIQLTFHRIPKTPWTIGYFPKGPKPDREIVEAIRQAGILHHAISIQFEPNDSMNPSTPHTYKTLGLTVSKKPMFTPHTLVIDLTLGEDKLLSSFHSKTRYNIKLAKKHNVIIKEDNSDEAFASYLRLTDETTKRQGFYAHSHTYHTRMWEMMKMHSIAHLFTATYNEELLAAWIVFVWKDTLYYPYGSSSRSHREVMAPTLLLWELIRFGIKNGCTSFDLWGALGPNPDPKDPWFGFHKFKLGFSPKLIEFAGSYDLVLHPMLYALYTWINNLRWFILNHRPRI